MVIMMKTNRKIIAVLLIIVLGLLNNIHTVKASYEPITPSESFDINAKLYIHQLSDMNEKTYTYSYSVDSNPHVYVHGNVTYGTDSGVNGAPTMTNSVTFSSSDFSADKQEFGLFYASKNLTVSLADMTFREPGIYYWKGTKTCSSSNYVTNNHSVFYIIVFVEDHEGVLQIVNKKVVAGADGTTVDVPDATGKLDAFMDEMVTTFHNLNVKKEVTGRLAKTTDAFEFTVTITVPSGYSGSNTFNVINSNTSSGNPTEIALSERTGTATFKLKHNEYIVIRDLPDGTQYTITEAEHTGYDLISIVANGDEQGRTQNLSNRQVNCTGLKGSTESVFINEKDQASPTGISLQDKAPLIGFLMGTALLGVLTIGRSNR